MCCQRKTSHPRDRTGKNRQLQGEKSMRLSYALEWREQSGIQSSLSAPHTHLTWQVPCISRSLRHGCHINCRPYEQWSALEATKADREDLLVVPWLRLCLPARGEGLIPSQGAKRSVCLCSQKTTHEKQTDNGPHQDDPPARASLEQPKATLLLV